MNPRTLAELILERAERRPGARFGMADAPLRLADAVWQARRTAARLAAAGLGPGSRAAVIGHTSNSYLLTWLALQLAGVEAALVNPSLPDGLLAQMLLNLRPDGVLWLNRPPAVQAVEIIHLDATHVDAGALLCKGSPLPDADPGADPAGQSRRPDDIAGYMHTSGTSGLPKFCAQTQSYYLRLGRFIADGMAISPADTVFAPLPMFHVNPLGYGVVGGLTAGADVLGATRFSASGFWPVVQALDVSVVFLHSPPVAILNRNTTAEDAVGHRLRAAFLADETFLNTFRVPLGFGAYGSTEAGGLCHLWTWRLGDHCPHPEGMARCAGLARQDVDWDLAADGEILVRGREPGALSAGYQTASGLVRLESSDGWFHTGDVGRRDEAGRLVFIERRSESIRVKGEYVPVAFVESVFAAIPGLKDSVLWRRQSPLVDHEVVLYVASDEPLPLAAICNRARDLPVFMRPSAVMRVDSLPRADGVGKVLRRELAAQRVLEAIDLDFARTEEIPIL